MCSPRNTGKYKNFSLWLTGGLPQGCPDFQKVYVFKVYVPFSCPINLGPLWRRRRHSSRPEWSSVAVSVLGGLPLPVQPIREVSNTCWELLQHHQQEKERRIWRGTEEAFEVRSCWFWPPGAVCLIIVTLSKEEQELALTHPCVVSEIKTTLRAKGALISEPRFSTPCDMRFFPLEKEKMAFVEGFSLKMAFSLSRVEKIARRKG